MAACAGVAPLFSAHAQARPISAVEVKLPKLLFVLRTDLSADACTRMHRNSFAAAVTGSLRKQLTRACALDAQA